MAKVSVIIPIYNVEKYLRECLESVIDQTLKDIEIICVDDGSPDNCPRICDEYAQKDNRIKVIHKENGGYGKAMNVGLDNATGEYIGIVEPDDFAEKVMFERLYSLAIDNDLDIARCQYYEYKTKDNSDTLVDSSWVIQNMVYSPMDDVTPFMQAPAIWSNIVRRELIVKNNIRFLETPGASYQDTSFAFKLYACCNRFMMINDALLHYRIDNANSSVNSLEKANYVNIEYAEIERFAKSLSTYKKLKKLIPKIKYACYKWNYERLNQDLKYEFLLNMSKEYRKHFKEGCVGKYFGTKSIIKLFIIAFFPILYKNRRAL